MLHYFFLKGLPRIGHTARPSAVATLLCFVLTMRGLKIKHCVDLFTETGGVTSCRRIVKVLCIFLWRWECIMNDIYEFVSFLGRVDPTHVVCLLFVS